MAASLICPSFHIAIISSLSACLEAIDDVYDLRLLMILIEHIVCSLLPFLPMEAGRRRG